MRQFLVFSYQIHYCQQNFHDHFYTEALTWCIATFIVHLSPQTHKPRDQLATPWQLLVTGETCAYPKFWLKVGGSRQLKLIAKSYIAWHQNPPRYCEKYEANWSSYFEGDIPFKLQTTASVCQWPVVAPCLWLISPSNSEQTLTNQSLSFKWVKMTSENVKSQNIMLRLSGWARYITLPSFFKMIQDLPYLMEKHLAQVSKEFCGKLCVLEDFKGLPQWNKVYLTTLICWCRLNKTCHKVYLH